MFADLSTNAARAAKGGDGKKSHGRRITRSESRNPLVPRLLKLSPASGARINRKQSKESAGRFMKKLPRQFPEGA